MGGLGGGHYTALSLNRFDDTWYEFNDSSYRSVDQTIHKHHTKSAYLLFYNRSEGDMSMPLNDRSPLIRRQSVSRPELWPHRQVEDRANVRSFTRSSRRLADASTFLPNLDRKRKNTADSATSSNTAESLAKQVAESSKKQAAVESTKKVAPKKAPINNNNQATDKAGAPSGKKTSASAKSATTATKEAAKMTSTGSAATRKKAPQDASSESSRKTRSATARERAGAGRLHDTSR
jgi:hypothetical protein